MKRIVITGFGVVASNGIGREAFSRALFGGVSGISPVALFDTTPFSSKTAGEVKDFSPQDILGPKGLRTLDRSTKLLSCAAKLALDDAGITIDEELSADAGVVVGTTLGSIRSISEFDRESIIEGPQYVNPALFPNTVINSPASQVSIRFNIKGLNATISTGFTASLDALGYAADFVRMGRVSVVLAGGVEELCQEIYWALYKTQFLAGIKPGSPEISCPFDKRRNGAVFGEAACIAALEPLERALKRGATILAEVTGYGSGFEPYRIDKYKSGGRGMRRAMHAAMAAARLLPPDIDYVSAAANSTVAADAIEADALCEVFGASAGAVPVTALKSMTGECVSASGMLQIAAAAESIRMQRIPPTLQYEEKDSRCPVSVVSGRDHAANISNVLVNACGPSGCNSSVIISKYKG